MKFVKLENYEQISQFAANIIIDEIKTNPNAILGLATGSTPVGIYEILVQKYNDGELDFSKIRTVNLDEYKGLDKNHIQSYYYFMCKHLFSHVNINFENVNLPNGLAENEKEECSRYDKVLAELGTRNIQILGIGENGHIGFNEPSDIFAKGTHCVKLEESTINANSRLFENKDEVPKYAYTMGIKQILNSEIIILIAYGEKKRAILKEALEGAVTPKIPASILQLCKNLVVITDK